jgi:hypothetical protein
MSLAQNYEKPIRSADGKYSDYGFILALVCLALGLVVASALFTPDAVRSEISSESSLVGP